MSLQELLRDNMTPGSLVRVVRSLEMKESTYISIICPSIDLDIKNQIKNLSDEYLKNVKPEGGKHLKMMEMLIELQYDLVSSSMITIPKGFYQEFYFKVPQQGFYGAEC